MDKKLQPLNPLQMYGFMPNAQNSADAVALEPCGYSRTRLASWRAFYWGNPTGKLEITSDSYCITKIITILFSSLKNRAKQHWSASYIPACCTGAIPS